MTTDLTGLTTSQVQERTKDGRVNRSVDPPTRTFAQILRSNAFTPVNAIMMTLFVLIIISGNVRDGLFVGVVVSNTIVGVVQEAKARRELARLQVLTQPEAIVVRDGIQAEIDAATVVIDDLIVLAPGSQVPVDARVVSESQLRVDESMLTGESEPLQKNIGDSVLSGSFVVSGNGYANTTAVGVDSFAGELTTEAKTFQAAESELLKSINRILKLLTTIIPVASILLLLSLLSTEDRWQNALQGTVAAAVAMVPDGLVLLTSLAFVAGVLEISRRNALARQLSTVEVLARVDVLCVDKTGTITTGAIAYSTVHPLGEHTNDDATNALSALAGADDTPNATMAAISEALGATSSWAVKSVEPFSSARKWSAVHFVDHGWIYLGAPDILLDEDPDTEQLIARLSEQGRRLVALGASNDGPNGDHAPSNLRPIAIVELTDELRHDARDVFEYFAVQDVTIKVISGDSADTVAAISERAGLRFAGEPVDVRQLDPTTDMLAETLQHNDIFGRVAPREKQAMVHALQKNGHVVAMTGDGVNDVLALKDSDLGIAMGSGSAASRSVADLVLTDNAFASLPVVVSEGRKVINNVERVANLFVSKATYAVLLTLFIGLARSPFPLLPRQLTLIGTFSIGIPGLVLALSPEVTRVRNGFLDRVLRFSIPAGTTAAIATFVAYEVARRFLNTPLAEARTLATIVLLGIGLAILVTASRPIRPWKVALAGAMAASYALVMVIPATLAFFELDLFGTSEMLLAALAIASGSAIVVALPKLVPGLSFRASNEL